MDLGLADRVYVVTGGSRGLGRATAAVLVAEGARVVLSGRSAVDLAAAGEAMGDAVVTVDVDNADPEAPQFPLRRYGHPEEFGRAAAFLLSPAA